MTEKPLTSSIAERIEQSKHDVYDDESKPTIRNFIFYRSPVFFALTIIFTALTTVATLILVIPFPATSGYFNLGDSLVMLSGLLLGPLGGFVAGGMGSALADMVGYPHFAPITLIVKGCEGLVVGLFSQQIKAASRIGGRDILGLILGAFVMLLGYFLAEAFLFGWEVAFLELVCVNSIQVTVGIFVAISVGAVARKYLVSALGSQTWGAR